MMIHRMMVLVSRRRKLAGMIIRRLLFHLSFSIFLLVIISSCGIEEKYDGNHSMMSVHKYCSKLAYEKEALICFSIEKKEKDWMIYGNSVFYLYQNKLDLFNKELDKIINKNSNWYLAGRLEESIFKHNMNKANMILNQFNDKSDNYDALYINDLKSEIFFIEGNWDKLNKLLTESSNKIIIDSIYLPVYQSYIYFDNDDIENVLRLIHDLQKNNNDVYEYILFNYYNHIGDKENAKNLRKKTKNPMIVIDYGYLQLEEGLVDEAKATIEAGLSMSNNAMDFVVPTALDMMTIGNRDIAKEIMDRQSQYISQDFYKKYWSDSSYYYLYQAWDNFSSGNTSYATTLLDKALTFSPKGFNENFLRFFICGANRDKSCQYDALVILREHSDNDPLIKYMVDDYIERYPDTSFPKN